MLSVDVTIVAPAPKEAAGEDVEAAEAAFIAELNRGGSDAAGFAVEGEGGTQASGTLVSAPAMPADQPAPSATLAPLPTLDQAIQRLSPQLREVLEDLFRAKFTSVRRISESSLDELRQ